MDELKIQDYICEELSLGDQEIAFDFVEYLKKTKWNLLRIMVIGKIKFII
jgi:hypothetical protein